MITIDYSKPFTNNIEKDVKDVRTSYLADLQKLREYYGDLFVRAAIDNSKPNLRRIV